MNELGHDPGYIVTHSALTLYSLEKRALPRLVILKTLKTEGADERKCPLYTALTYTEFKFLGKLLPFKMLRPISMTYMFNSKCPVLSSKTKTEAKPDLQKSN